jgi:hypothetical protein
MRTLLIAACSALPLLVADGPKAIAPITPQAMVRRALTAYTRDDAIERQYTYLQRNDFRILDGDGNVKHRDIHTFDITLLEGSPYRRLVKRNDQPLSPDEEKQQKANLQRSIDERRRETAEQRRQRVADWDRKRLEKEKELEEVPYAFDLRLVGEDVIDGVPVWIIDGTPHPGYEPKSKTASYFTKMKGRIWISKSDFHTVKIDAVTTDTIAISAFLIRFAKGGHVAVEFSRVNNEVWLPKHVVVAGSARVLLVKGYHVDADFTFSDYKKFSTESRIVDTSQQH